MKDFKSFTNKSSKSMTLRNELVPVGKTLDTIINSEVREKDENRSELYKKN